MVSGLGIEGALTIRWVGKRLYIKIDQVDERPGLCPFRRSNDLPAPVGINIV